MTNTGKAILIVLGVAAVGTAGYFIFRKKKTIMPAANPAQADNQQIPATATNPYVATADKKKSNVAKTIGIGAAVAAGALALDLLIKGNKKSKEAKERKAKGIPVTSTGINPKLVL